MNDAILKKLEERTLNRRSFLRGSGLAALALAGAAALPRAAFAQDQQPSDKKDDKDGEKKDDLDDEYKITRKDERGRDYRVCPQCGNNMYKQERTWTCENCGYSYTE
jgi:ribosomal protein S27AE